MLLLFSLFSFPPHAKNTIDKLKDRKKRVMLFTESCRNGETLLGVKWSQIPEQRWYKESSDGYCYDLEEMIKHLDTKLSEYQRPRFPWTNTLMSLTDVNTIVKTARERGVDIPLKLELVLLGINRGQIPYSRLKEHHFDVFFNHIRDLL